MIDLERENSDIEVVSHETTHQMAGNTGLLPRHVQVPRWVHEGLATYFETPNGASWGAIGAVNDSRLKLYRVLASDENAASAASMDAQAFDALHQVLSRFYRVIVIDTGNNMRASNWQAAVAAADQVVIVSTIREDTAQSAAWALDALRATGNDDAVRRAVTILSAPDRKIDKDLRKRLRSHFGALTRAVVEVPYDPSLVSGGPIAY